MAVLMAAIRKRLFPLISDSVASGGLCSALAVVESKIDRPARVEIQPRPEYGPDKYVPPIHCIVFRSIGTGPVVVIGTGRDDVFRQFNEGELVELYYTRRYNLRGEFKGYEFVDAERVGGDKN